MIGYTSKASWDEIKINYKIDHGSIGVASRGILSAGPFQKSFTAGDDAQGCCGGRGHGQNSRERRTALASKNFGLEHWIAEIFKLLDEQRGMDEE